MLLVDLARQHGVAMGSKHGGRLIGWTLSEDAAILLRQHGATVTTGYNATGPKGWEIACLPLTDAAPRGDAAPPSEDTEAAEGTEA